MQKNSRAVALVLLAGFILLFLASFGLRWANREMYAPQMLENTSTAQVVVLEEGNAEAAAEAEANAAEELPASQVAGVVFVGLLPLFSSLLNAGIAWIADDPVAARLESIRESLLKNRQQQADLDAALQTLPGHNEAVQMLLAEDAAFERAAERVQSRVRLMHVVAIQVLEEALAEPSVTSQLSEHCLSELNRSLKAAAADPASSPLEKSMDRKYA